MPKTVAGWPVKSGVGCRNADPGQFVAKTVADRSGNQAYVVVVQILYNLLSKTVADWSGNQG